MLIIRMCVINFRALIIESLHIVTYYMSEATKMPSAKLIKFDIDTINQTSFIPTRYLEPWCNFAIIYTPQIEANYWEEYRESRRRTILGSI